MSLLNYVLCLVGGGGLLLLPCFPAAAQQPQPHHQRLLLTDSTRRPTPACKGKPLVNFYSVRGKYPRNSSTLSQEAQRWLQQQPGRFTGSGYVNFRFIVDCAGRLSPLVEVTQTDTRYRSLAPDPLLAEALLGYLRSLTEWRHATDAQGTPVNYYGYMSFKLADGKVVAVIP